MCMNIDRFKFRAWVHNPEDSAQGEMRHDKVCPTGDNTISIDGCRFYENECILMQCTGLKDSDGKLIYEGDIIHSLGESILSSDDPLPGQYIRIVKHDENYGCLTLAYVDGNCRVSGYTFCKSNAEKFFVIIGNIYENPELLTEDDN